MSEEILQAFTYLDFDGDDDAKTSAGDEMMASNDAEQVGKVAVNRRKHKLIQAKLTQVNPAKFKLRWQGKLICQVNRVSLIASISNLTQVTSKPVAEIQQALERIPFNNPRDRATSVVESDEEMEICKRLVPQDDDEIDRMIGDTLDLPHNKESKSLYSLSPLPTPKEIIHTPVPSPAKTDSTTPCPLWCECGTKKPEGDNDPDEVQCRLCGWWSHTGFEPGDIIMMPNPRAPDWTASDVLWYPAKFIKRYERSAKTKREYKFEWLDCNDYSVHEPDDSVAPFLLVQTYYQSRAYCTEIMDVTLTPEKVGKIRLPFFMNPSDRAVHENPRLSAIFELAITPLSLILARFEDSHPVIKKYNHYFSGKTSEARRRASVDWLGRFHLYPTPELECLILAAQQRLITHPNLTELPGFERNERIWGVGSALLQILAIQDQLGEPLNLNGDTIDDLTDKSIVFCPVEGVAALTSMLVSTDPAALKAKKRWSTEQLSRYQVRFNADHVTYDPTLRPPIFHRVKPSNTKPTEAIILEDAEVSARPGKRKNIGNSLDEKPVKKRKTGADVGEKGAEKRSKNTGATTGKQRLPNKVPKSTEVTSKRPEPRRSSRLR
ncbi:hypothetical protein B0H10DRAFT_2192856 [Mycena sp. CBHHK59/15]|nr:hypothetical protein B0H10DRAFT_2192856 [Mycena sp. CBHHK59/15]